MSSQKISISIPHKLSQEDAQERIARGVNRAKQKLSGNIADVRETWTGNRMDFTLSALGGQITGRAEVETSSVRVELDLPWAMSMLGPRLRDALEQEGRRALESK